MAAPFKEHFYQPRYDQDLPSYKDLQFQDPPQGASPKFPLPFIPRIQNFPSGKQPSLDGYPWWVDPTFLNRPPAQEEPPLPPFQLGPTDFAGRSKGTPMNWLLSQYDRNGDSLRPPIRAVRAGAGPGPGAAPTEIPGGLLGMLYETMRQGQPTQDAGPDSDAQDASEQAMPKWRLGRRTYRA